jgi:hypothetical protein
MHDLAFSPRFYWREPGVGDYLPAAPALAAIACATLFNMLRAADWGFNTGAKQQRGARR